MSLFNVFQVSSSAMTAQSMRLNAVASNLANADSIVSSDGKPYRAKQVQRPWAATATSRKVSGYVRWSMMPLLLAWFTTPRIQLLMQRGMSLFQTSMWSRK